MEIGLSAQLTAIAIWGVDPAESEYWLFLVETSLFTFSTTDTIKRWLSYTLIIRDDDCRLSKLSYTVSRVPLSKQLGKSFERRLSGKTGSTA